MRVMMVPGTVLEKIYEEHPDQTAC